MDAINIQEKNAAKKLSEKKKIQFAFDAIADNARHHWDAISIFFYDRFTVSQNMLATFSSGLLHFDVAC